MAEHRYPRKWSYGEGDSTLLVCEAKGDHLWHLHDNGIWEPLDNLYEDCAEKGVKLFGYIEIFDEPPCEVLEQFQRREAVVYLKGVIKQMRETHQAEIAKLRSEIEQLESRLAQADFCANGG